MISSNDLNWVKTVERWVKTPLRLDVILLKPLTEGLVQRPHPYCSVQGGTCQVTVSQHDQLVYLILVAYESLSQLTTARTPDFDCLVIRRRSQVPAR